MLKKVLFIAAVATSLSLATWDKFPVLEGGHGQAHVGITYDKVGDASAFGAYAGARYSVINQLELGLNIPYTFILDDGIDETDDESGLGNLTFLVRYQFLPILNVFLDVDFPIGDEDVGSDDGFGFHAGVQYSSEFGPIVLGTELGFSLATEGDDDVTPAKELNIGAEVDWPLGFVTPYIGGDFAVKVTDTDFPIGDGDDSGDAGFTLYIGGDFVINPTFDVDVSGYASFGEDYNGTDDTPLGADVHLNINF